MNRINIFSLTREELATALGGSPLIDSPAHRARLLYKEIYANKGIGLEKLNISKRLHPFLNEQFTFELPIALESLERSESDGSAKMMLRLTKDDSLVETVLVPERNRLTQCISTQVGCRQGCVFCHTGRMGLSRNLSIEEIVGQVVFAENFRTSHPDLAGSTLAKYEKISNVVYMGMGEPLDNLENVIASTHILTDDQGLRLSPNKVTVSTIGILPALDLFLQTSPVSLALSLHSPFEGERSQLIPANRKHRLTQVVEVLRQHAQERGREYFVQYMMAQGVNDTPAHAQAIADLFKGIPVKINLIPINEHDATSLARPSINAIYSFQQQLKSLGLVATVRLSKGRDIQAACGQLVAQHQRS